MNTTEGSGGFSATHRPALMASLTLLGTRSIDPLEEIKTLRINAGGALAMLAKRSCFRLCAQRGIGV